MSNTYNGFLLSHKTTKTQTPTHTRIGNKELNIYGASYCISTDELPQFHKLYYNYVIENGNKEYLTEKQNGLTLALDFDFKYEEETPRQHSLPLIEDIINAYMDELKNVLMLTDTPIMVYVMERETQTNNGAKDGIHIFINVKINHILQEILREKMLVIINELLLRYELRVVNDINNILDETITRGTTNWNMYGSAKPNYEPYKITFMFKYQLDLNDNEFIIDRIEDFKMTEELFTQLSVQNTNNPEFEMNPKVMKLYYEKTKPTQPQEKQSIKELVHTEFVKKEMNEMNETERSLFKLNYIFDNGFNAELQQNKDHLTFTKIGYALFNDFGEGGLEIYLKMAYAYSSNYNEDEYRSKYINSLSKVKNNIHISTIYYTFKSWNAKLLNKLQSEYKIKTNSNINDLLNKSIISQTDYDFALLLKEIINNKFKCVDIGKKTWYEFIGERWIEDKQLNIRNLISSKMVDLYNVKLNEINKELEILFSESNEDNDKETKDQLVKKINKLKMLIKSNQECINKCKKTNDKNNILREVMEICFDKELIDKFDMNPYLFAFKNCIFDLRTGEQIEGKFNDYIYRNTGYDYIEDYPKERIEELQQIINSILPNEETQHFYLSALATGMSGLQVQHLFIATGSGGNGKSISSSLLMDMLGEYAYKLPKTTLQSSIKEGANPAIANLHKKRFVLAQEPEKDKKLCGSTIKDITGDKDINARQLYSGETKTLLNGTFLLECNDMPIIDEVGDAISRRLRAIPFKTSALEQSDFDNLTETEKQSGKYLLKNVFYITDEFRTKYKQAFFHILIEKFKEFYKNGNVLPIQSTECKSKTLNYLATSDDIFSWFSELYEPLTEEEFGTEADKPIKISDIYDIFGSSEFYKSMSKLDKRLYNKSGFLEKIENNSFLRKSFKGRNIRHLSQRVNVPYLSGWKLIQTEEEEDH